jgi:hypothetical protein
MLFIYIYYGRRHGDLQCFWSAVACADVVAGSYATSVVDGVVKATDKCPQKYYWYVLGSAAAATASAHIPALRCAVLCCAVLCMCLHVLVPLQHLRKVFLCAATCSIVFSSRQIQHDLRLNGISDRPDSDAVIANHAAPPATECLVACVMLLTHMFAHPVCGVHLCVSLLCAVQPWGHCQAVNQYQQHSNQRPHNCEVPARALDTRAGLKRGELVW